MRSLSTLRSLRVLALFAWLLLAISVPAIASGAFDCMTQASSVAAAGGMHQVNAAGAHAHRDRDCCGDPAHPECHCSAMCCNALVPAISALSASALAVGRYGALPTLDAPTLDRIPPLRPPAA